MNARAARRGRSRVRSARVAGAIPPRRLLLDTHVWLWWQADDSRLGPQARRAIAGAAEVRVSAASVWEIAIKAALGKLTLPGDVDFSAELERGGITPLPVEIAHADALRHLPSLHRDPFDRLLVAQALSEGLGIVTADSRVAAYDVAVIDAAL